MLCPCVIDTVLLHSITFLSPSPNWLGVWIVCFTLKIYVMKKHVLVAVLFFIAVVAVNFTVAALTGNI